VIKSITSQLISHLDHAHIELTGILNYDTEVTNCGIVLTIYEIKAVKSVLQALVRQINTPNSTYNSYISVTLPTLTTPST